MTDAGSLRSILHLLRLDADLSWSLTVFALLSARMAAASSSLPFLGGRTVPRRVRVGLAMAFAVVLFPSLAPKEDPGWSFGWFLCLLAKEILTGALIGVLVRVVFAAIESAGYLVEFGAGLRPEAVLDPQLDTESSLLGQILGKAAVVFCLAAGFHLALLRLLADSYQLVPLDRIPAPGPRAYDLALAAGKMTGGMLALALQLSAPILLVLLLVNLGAALIFRVSSLRVTTQPLLPAGSLALVGCLLLSGGLMLDEVLRSAMVYLDVIHDLLIKVGGAG
jgi:flagellar biosynthetic protein FliR